MATANAQAQKETLFRSNQKIRMVREETRRDGSVILIDAMLPCGRGWNQGHPGSVDWQNMNIGWIPYDVYMREKNSSAAEEKRQEAVITAAKAAEEAAAKAAIADEEAAIAQGPEQKPKKTEKKTEVVRKA